MLCGRSRLFKSLLSGISCLLRDFRGHASLCAGMVRLLIMGNRRERIRDALPPAVWVI